VSDPQSEIAAFLRAKFGHPSPEVERVIEAFAALAGGAAAPTPASQPAAATVPDDLVTRLDAIQARLTKLEATSATPAASPDESSITERLDAIDRAMVALQGSVSKLETAPHLAAAPARSAAPARAAAPAAKPAA
jgi:hypothetical protein